MSATAVRRPDFVFIGPDKSGSTWLQKVLRLHPDVFLPVAKDTYYFDREYERGEEWYLSHFRRAESERVVGEICHDYLFSEAAPTRMHALIPDARLMVSLREPVERTWSAYLNLQRNGWEVGSLTEAVAQRPELVDNSRYARHLRRFLDHYPRERLHVAWFDELQRDPQLYLDGVTDFLGIQRQELDEELRAPARPAARARSKWVARGVKRGAVVLRAAGRAGWVGRLKGSPLVQRTLYASFDGGAPTMSDADRDVVRGLLREDVRELEELLGVDVTTRWGWS